MLLTNGLRVHLTVVTAMHERIDDNEHGTEMTIS